MPVFSNRCLIGLCFLTLLTGIPVFDSAHSQETASDDSGLEIPKALQPWRDWVTWDVEELNCPSLYNKSDQRVCFWPSRLSLHADATGGEFSASFRAFESSWVPLPGSSELWPSEVQIDGDATPVIQRNGHPAVYLPEGTHEVTGGFSWEDMPQRIVIPEQIGLLSLQVDGKEITNPVWDNKGHVWLKRTRSTTENRDHVSVEVYRLIEDGIPLWLETEVEITVSGKSREESLGWVLPEGWELSTVRAPIPVAIDDRGAMKAQVRAGKWTVSLRAFRTSNPSKIAYASDSEPIASEELVGFKTNPQFRIAQLEGIPTVDVTQTTYPDKWRGFSVHRWETSQPFQLVEKMRGEGNATPPGLTMARRLWLDEDGKSITYRDALSGEMQRTWRLDVADHQELGAVRVDGQAQLITENPATGASGVEIRRRNLQLSAIGRMQRSPVMPATGWQTNVDSLRIAFALPPGWRMFAVLGADEVAGDWLTAWSLLDVFLLLVFTFAVYRLFGFLPGVIALLAFGLAYHELGAPRLTWLLLLMPLALLRVVDSGAIFHFLRVWKALAILLLLFNLVPFVARQTQGVIYPQLERTGYVYGQRFILSLPSDVYRYPEGRYDSQTRVDAPSTPMADEVDFQVNQQAAPPKLSKAVVQSRFQSNQKGADFSNLKYAETSRIQTGPAEPRWKWNEVQCSWNGPVTADQQIRPIFISLTQHRILSIIRVLLLMLLAGLLLRPRKKLKLSAPTKSAVAAVIAFLLMGANVASAQFPDSQMLDDLKRRLTEQHERIDDAAEIPNVNLTLDGTNLQMKATVHAADEVAVPLPGQLPSWSPVSVELDDGKPTETIRRDGYLWVLVPKGIHEVSLKGRLPETNDWAWTFLLRPKTVTIDAPNWKISGVDRNRIPQSQVFFVREQDSGADRAAYDRSNFQPIVAVDRHVEIGLISKVRTVVRRLSAPGKAVSLSIPLLPGENVLTSQRNVQDSMIAVQLAANESEFTWSSELTASDSLQLNASDTNLWVERWHLVTSPIWNVSMSGIAPIYEANEQDLIPAWHPWPGESVDIQLSKPVAIQGDIVTIQNVDYDTQLGSRLRNYTLSLDLECSIANDFVVELDSNSQNVSLEIDGKPVPVQQVDSSLTLSLQPGRHLAKMEWRSPLPLTTVTRSATVTLPIEASNISSTVVVPNNRWVLWANGPMRGPAVRFWTILIVAVLLALGLGSVPLSPLRRYEWVLLSIGLTQVPMFAAAFVVGWLFLLAWRGQSQQSQLGPASLNLLQIVLVVLTLISLGVLILVLSQGLLGNPDMFIEGNGSTRTYLRWFEPRIADALPSTTIVSVSVWFYRLLMLFWALWLATALLRWLTWGWEQFTNGGGWKPLWTPRPTPPTLANAATGSAIETPGVAAAKTGAAESGIAVSDTGANMQPGADSSDDSNPETNEQPTPVSQTSPKRETDSIIEATIVHESEHDPTTESSTTDDERAPGKEPLRDEPPNDRSTG